MSLLLDALNRASKERQKAVAATVADAPPAEPLQWEPVPAAVLDVPVVQPQPEPQLEPTAPQDPDGPDTWELSLAQDGVPDAPTSPPAPAFVSEPVAPPAPIPVVLAAPHVLPEPAPVSTQTQVHSPAGSLAAPPQSTAVEPHLHVAPPVVPVPPSQVAREILRASAIPSVSAGANRRRIWMLGGLALVLALVLGVVFSGLLGDPGQLLGLGGSSSLATAPTVTPSAGVPAVPAPLPATVASAADVVVASASAPLPGSADGAPVETPPAPPLVAVPPVLNAKAVKPVTPLPTTKVHPVPPSAQGSGARMPAPSSSDAGSPASEGTLRAGGLPRSAIATSTRAPGLLEQGYAALLDGRFDAAAQAYRQALRANAQERDALLGLAYISQQKGQRAEAQAYYREVLRQEPTNAIATAGLQALDARPESTALNPMADAAVGQADSAAAMAAAGSALVREGRLGDAAQAFARAQSLEPANPLHAYNHAVAQDRMGRYELALRLYENVLQLDAAAPAALRGYQLETVRTRVAQLRAAVGATPPRGAP